MRTLVIHQKGDNVDSQSVEIVLRLFNEKTDRLLGLSFWPKSHTTGALVEFNQNSGWDSLFVGPDEESIQALMLTLRMFMQDNESISLQKMRSLYTGLISGELSIQFFDHCSRLNTFLDSTSHLSIEKGRQLTYRCILDIFLYGTYAHMNSKKRQIFEGIRTTAFFPIFQTSLVQAIIEFGGCLKELKKINEEVLIKLSQGQSP
jgi:hypothetical protein